MNNILSLFTGLIFASRAVLVPVPLSEPAQPAVSFANLSFKQQILGESTNESPSIKKSFDNRKVTIALLGDSMTDTLGSSFDELQTQMKEAFPGIEVAVLNYGVGATNIEQGISRITTDYEYNGRKMQAMTRIKPDIVILESFAYNPFPEQNSVNKHWVALAKTRDAIKKHIPDAKIIIATTVSPNSVMFAKGSPDINFTAEERRKYTDTIKEYLESTIRFARGEKLPLADGYSLSLLPTGDGDPVYINPTDNIHPSDAGRNLLAKTIVQTIQEDSLLD